MDEQPNSSYGLRLSPRAPTWRRGGPPSQGRVFQTTQQSNNPPRNTSNACFNRGQEGHFARNFPRCQNHTGTANLIDLEDDEYYIELEPSDPVNDVCTRLEALTIDQQSQLAKDMGVKEDFPTA